MVEKSITQMLSKDYPQDISSSTPDKSTARGEAQEKRDEKTIQFSSVLHRISEEEGGEFVYLWDKSDGTFKLKEIIDIMKSIANQNLDELSGNVVCQPKVHNESNHQSVAYSNPIVLGVHGCTNSQRRCLRCRLQETVD